jgi:ubiquinone/menaquinone biosynthesis C-methylase UbiE
MLNAVRRRLPLAMRADAVELLDSGRLSLPDVERNLADIARLNRLPGGTATSVDAIRRLAGSRPGIQVVDVGTGRADMPIAFAELGWQVTALDSNPDVLVVARRETRGHPRIDVVAGDARRLPFPDEAFDVAHCSLLLHHLGPGEAATVLHEMARVSRLGIVVNDLRRGVAPLVTTWVATILLARSGVTRHDGLASARRAYTVAEVDALVERAGLVRRWRSRAWLPRIVTVAARP